jgi:hypothetical protein
MLVNWVFSSMFSRACWRYFSSQSPSTFLSCRKDVPTPGCSEWSRDAESAGRLAECLSASCHLRFIRKCFVGNNSENLVAVKGQHRLSTHSEAVMQRQGWGVVNRTIISANSRSIGFHSFLYHKAVPGVHFNLVVTFSVLVRVHSGIVQHFRPFPFLSLSESFLKILCRALSTVPVESGSTLSGTGYGTFCNCTSLLPF